MNETEARLTLARHLASYHSRSYAYLATAAFLGRIDRVAVGKYQITVKASWKNAPEGEVRVVGSISDGSRRITEEFNVMPIGELAAL
jgi:hypothetical protein